MEQDDIRRMSESAELRQMAQNSLTGLSQTSFGQSQLGAIRTEGEREVRRAEEKYRMADIELQLNRATTMSQAGQQQVDLIGGQAGALSDLRRAYTTSISGLQTSLAERMLQGGENVAEGGFETAMGRAQNIGSGFNLGGALVGAGLCLPAWPQKANAEQTWVMAEQVLPLRLTLASLVSRILLKSWTLRHQQNWTSLVSQASTKVSKAKLQKTTRCKVHWISALG
jgi:hypothetical protein